MTSIQNQYQANKEQARHNREMEAISRRELADKEKQTGLKSMELEYKKPIYQAQAITSYIDSIGSLFSNIGKGVSSFVSPFKSSGAGTKHIESITITRRDDDGTQTSTKQENRW